LLLSAGVLPGCKGCTGTHFEQVPLTGLMQCPPTPAQKSRALVRPIVVDLTGDDTHVRHVFDGWSLQTRARTVSPPEGRHGWTARFGQCSRSPVVHWHWHWHCTKVDWHATRAIEIDSAVRGASIVVPAPPSSECADAVPRRDR